MFPLLSVALVPQSIKHRMKMKTEKSFATLLSRLVDESDQNEQTRRLSLRAHPFWLSITTLVEAFNGEDTVFIQPRESAP